MIIIDKIIIKFVKGHYSWTYVLWRLLYFGLIRLFDTLDLWVDGSLTTLNWNYGIWKLC